MKEVLSDVTDHRRTGDRSKRAIHSRPQGNHLTDRSLLITKPHLRDHVRGDNLCIERLDHLISRASEAFWLSDTSIAHDGAEAKEEA